MTLNNVAWKVLFQLSLDPYPQANDVVTKDLGIFPTLDVFLQGNYAGFTGMPMRLVVWSYMVMHGHALKKIYNGTNQLRQGQFQSFFFMVASFDAILAKSWQRFC